jgi:hypothetical protein
MQRIAIALALVLGACSGGSGGGGGGDDDDGVQPDAAGEPDSGEPLPACTNAAFDPCTSNDQCTSGNCHLFMQDGIQVCTQACTPLDDSTCPVDANGVNGECNMKGICKPSAANACSR